MSDLSEPRDPLASATPEEAAAIIDQALAPFSDKPDVPPISLEDQAADVLEDLVSENPDVSQEELAAIVAERKDLFPRGSAQTPEDFKLALRTAAELASRDRQIGTLSDREREADIYEAERAIENAASDDELYDAISELEQTVGRDSAHFEDALQTMASGTGADAAVAPVVGRSLRRG